MKATSPLQVVLRLGISGTMSFVPVMPLWHGHGIPLLYLLYLTTWNGVFHEKLIVPSVCEPEVSSTCSPEPACCPEAN
jgi:hypothetical protein